jgi:DNA polymerase III sliding clamp (beta) subunit (PCNA family)
MSSGAGRSAASDSEFDSMRVTLERSNLLRSLGHVHRVVERRNTIPILSNVLLDANDGELTMKATDLDLEITESTPAQAVDRVSTISSERGRAVKLSIADGQVILAVNNPDSGSATEELAADYSSDPIEIGFNARYLLDVAAQMSGSDARFLLADAGSPTLINDMSDDQALYVLMPMRV